nr:MAG TPA: hypothetical protein [Bacteriophage sp.]
MSNLPLILNGLPSIEYEPLSLFIGIIPLTVALAA